MKYFLITIITIMALVGCGGAEERKEIYLEKAKLSLEAGDLDKARIELKNVLQIDPKDARAYFQLGDIYDMKKDYNKAFGNYIKAEELAPENLEYHAKIGTYLLILAGDIDAAIEKRDLVLGKDGSNVSGLLLKAGILLKQKDAAGAMRVTQDIFSKQPDHIQNTMFLSSLYQRDKRYDDSISVLNACIKENPKDRSLVHALANAYLKAGKHDLAEIEYRGILKKRPDVFSNYLQLASFYRQIDKIDSAEEVLRNAIEEDKKDSERKLVLIDFIQRARGNPAAIDELKATIAKNPRMGVLRLVLGNLYVIENRLDDAEKTFKLASSEFSEDSVGIKSRVKLASLYMQKKNVNAAVNIVDEALKISPNDSEVNFINAKLLLLKRDYDGAIISLRRVVKDTPENIEAYILLSTAHRGNGEEQQGDEVLNQAYEKNRANAVGLLKLARHHAGRKDSAKLEKVINNYLSIDDSNYEALSYKSALLSERKMFAEVKPYATRMLELYPDMPNGYIQSVAYMLAENKKVDAISLLEQGYDKVDQKNHILELLVLLHVSMKNFDGAISKVQSAIHESGETAELYMLLAKVQMASSYTEDAKKSLNKVSNIKPDWKEPYLQLANIYMAEKQSQKAIETLQQGLAELGSNLKITLAITKIYESIGDYNAAIREYEKAYERNNENVVLANNLAVLLSEHRKDENSLKRAKELADKLKNIDKVVILDTVGWIYYKVGDYVEAVNILKTVVEKSPDVAVFNYHLGMALYKIGDEAAAKTYLASSIANNSDFPGKDDAKVYLQKLQ